MKKHSKKTIFKGSIFNLKNYVSTDDMQLHNWYAKATELALTYWQQERLPDFKKVIKKEKRKSLVKKLEDYEWICPEPFANLKTNPDGSMAFVVSLI